MERCARGRLFGLLSLASIVDSMSTLTRVIALAATLVVLLPVAVCSAPFDGLVADLIPSVQSGETVAVAELDSDTVGRTAGFIADEITEAFVRAGIAVVERKNIQRISDELRFQLSGSVQSESAAEVGRALGADYILFGTIREIVRPEYANTGLKILVQLVNVEEGRVVRSASVEVEASDMSSPYRRRSGRRSAEYPAFLNLRLGAAYLATEYRNADADEPADSRGFGLSGGLGFQPEDQGFFSSGWEFLYAWEREQDRGLEIVSHNLSLGRLLLIRIPMWRYLDSLPFLTHAYLGLLGAAGFSFNQGDAGEYFGVNLKGEGVAGWSQGLSDAANLFVEYRFAPRLANMGVYGFGAEKLNSLGLSRRREHQLMIGISLLP